ncbi:glycosyltransferase 87 family protein [Amycolatopsis sp. cmx-4-68]|uniref:glycosyltransferase 87 family protein n=1 Tax=Amycolatopsis sp. cmx-4-68 TaxID=2790938 RepID=UPI00397AB48A
MGIRTVTATATAAFALVAAVWWSLGRPLGVDSAVYRAGGIAVLRGEPLYGHLSALPGWAPELPFTYPPFAALLFTPFAAVPVQWCWGLVALMAAPALVVALRPYAPGAGVLLAAFALQPVWQTIGLGQLNLVLMALVVLDVLHRRGSTGGVLIGLAAAIKLVPLIFVGHLLLTGRRADAARALGTFAAATTLGAVLLPGDSVRYWTSALFNDHFA